MNQMNKSIVERVRANSIGSSKFETDKPKRNPKIIFEQSSTIDPDDTHVRNKVKPALVHKKRNTV